MRERNVRYSADPDVGPYRSQTQITQFGAAPFGHHSNQVSDHKTVLHAYLAWVGSRCLTGQDRG